MKTSILSFLCFTLCSFQLQAQGIFDASIHTAVGFGSVNSPIGEGPQQIIDQNPNTKFLDFNNFDGMGFEVEIGESVTASSIRIVTANDAPERDPTEVEVLSSPDGATYVSLATITIPCIADRFLARTFQFENTTAHRFYRINFTGNCNPSNIIQVADVQLFPTIGTPPALTCPSNLLIPNTMGQCDGVATFEISSEDMEDGTLTTTQILGLPSGSTFPLGATDMVFSTTDSDNNTTSCNFIVTVEDTEAPVLDCPLDMTINIDPGETTAIVNYVVASSDNCSAITPIADYTALGTIDGQSYYLSDASFEAANAFTAAEGIETGFVGTIRNQADNEFLTNTIRGVTGGVVDVLIGYNDIATEGTFVWHSGDAATYDNWNTGEPNNAGPGGTSENYTVVLDNGTWNDFDGLTSFRYLLETDFMLLQTEGLSSGSEFPIGTTTNRFETADAAGNPANCQFNITVNDGSLAVELLDFQLKQAHPQTIILEWTTLTEQENKGFHILKSQNGRDWNTIGFVVGHGTSSKAHTYEFEDSAPFIGDNYYRLEQIDINGESTLSEVRWFDYKATPTNIVVFPNPAHDQIQIRLNDTVEKANIHFFNHLGQQVLFEQVTNGQFSAILPIHHLPRGVYLVQIEADNLMVIQKLTLQ